MLAAQQSMLLHGLQTQRENLLIYLQTQPLSDNGQAGVIGSVLVQFVAEEAANGDRVGTPGRNRPLTGKVFKKTYHDHLQIDHRIDSRPPYVALLVSRRTNLAHLLRKTKTFQ